MARTIDASKIERIKEATVQMVVSKGYGNASVSEIARKAGVAEGYLYRYYKSKSELVEDLLYQSMNELADKLEGLLNDNHSIYEIFEHLIRTLFSIANDTPERIKFLYVLMNDYNFRIKEQQRQRIFDLCRRIKDKGLRCGEVRMDVDEEEIYLIAVTYPIQFINLRLKFFFNRSELGDSEIEKVLRICKNLIKG